jgi:hypothetical protein
MSCTLFSTPSQIPSKCNVSRRPNDALLLDVKHENRTAYERRSPFTIERTSTFRPNSTWKNSGRRTHLHSASSAKTSASRNVAFDEFSDRIEEADIGVQADAFLDRPASPLFIPQSTGKDISTQIEPGDVNTRSFDLFVDGRARLFSCSTSIWK